MFLFILTDGKNYVMENPMKSDNNFKFYGKGIYLQTGEIISTE